MSGLVALDPLPHTRRGWIALVITGVLFIVAFLLVIRFYNSEGGSTVDGGLGPSDVSGLIVTVQPDTVDATKNQATLQLAFGVEAADLTGSDGRLSKNLRVTVGTSDGLDEYKFPAGSVMSERLVIVGTMGEEANYPFDEHSGDVILTADVYTKNSDGSLSSVETIPMGVQAMGGVNGWDTFFTLPTGFSDAVVIGVDYNRAFSTQLFALLIVAIAGVLALLALATAVLVQSNRRPAEAALLSWTAALLFALPALRNYLPNGPPFGASIDMYAYLWFMLAAGVASVLCLVGWNDQKLAERRQASEQRRLATSQEVGTTVVTGDDHAS